MIASGKDARGSKTKSKNPPCVCSNTIKYLDYAGTGFGYAATRRAKRLLKNVLVNNFGIADDAQYIKTLRAAEATRSAIIAAFRDFPIVNTKAAHEAGKDAEGVREIM